MKVHDVEINFTENSSPEFSIKIDGKEFGRTSGIVIRSPCANDFGKTTVEIKFFAKVRGNVRTDMIVKTKIKL